jgi:hypothetical protein
MVTSLLLLLPLVSPAMTLLSRVLLLPLLPSLVLSNAWQLSAGVPASA